MHIFKMYGRICHYLPPVMNCMRHMTEHSVKRSLINGRFLIWLVMLIPVAIPARANEPPVLYVLGDSLTAGYGLPPENAFPQRLQKYLVEQGIAVRVENAGVSGDTTADGLARLDWSVGPDADAVIIELGANDALRGLPPEAAEANLDAILQRLRERKLPVLIAGMLALRNLGPEYTAAFDGIYPKLAKKYDAPLFAFFLQGVAQDPALNQPDMLHPNEAGVDVIVRNIAPQVIELLRGL